MNDRWLSHEVKSLKKNLSDVETKVKEASN